jgi:hypothetical protein
MSQRYLLFTVRKRRESRHRPPHKQSDLLVLDDLAKNIHGARKCLQRCPHHHRVFF